MSFFHRCRFVAIVLLLVFVAQPALAPNPQFWIDFRTRVEEWMRYTGVWNRLVDTLSDFGLSGSGEGRASTLTDLIVNELQTLHNTHSSGTTTDWQELARDLTDKDFRKAIVTDALSTMGLPHIVDLPAVQAAGDLALGMYSAVVQRSVEEINSKMVDRMKDPRAPTREIIDTALPIGEGAFDENFGRPFDASYNTSSEPTDVTNLISIAGVVVGATADHYIVLTTDDRVQVYEKRRILFPRWREASGIENQIKRARLAEAQERSALADMALDIAHRNAETEAAARESGRFGSADSTYWFNLFLSLYTQRVEGLSVGEVVSGEGQESSIVWFEAPEFIDWLPQGTVIWRRSQDAFEPLQRVVVGIDFPGIEIAARDPTRPYGIQPGNHEDSSPEFEFAQEFQEECARDLMDAENALEVRGTGSAPDVDLEAIERRIREVSQKLGIDEAELRLKFESGVLKTEKDLPFLETMDGSQRSTFDQAMSRPGQSFVGAIRAAQSPSLVETLHRPIPPRGQAALNAPNRPNPTESFSTERARAPINPDHLERLLSVDLNEIDILLRAFEPNLAAQVRAALEPFRDPVTGRIRPGSEAQARETLRDLARIGKK